DLTHATNRTTAMHHDNTSNHVDPDAILGHRLHGSGPRHVIVLHDWMGDAANYDPIIPWLDSNAFTYAFADVRGYGASKSIAGCYSSEEIARDITNLANHLGWPRYGLVGHSMSAMAVFRHLVDDARSERRITRAVAITPVTASGYPATADDRAFLAGTITDDAVAVAAYGALTGGRSPRRWAEDKTARHRAVSSVTAVRGYYDMWLGEDFAQSFASAGIDIPVLVIGGRNDLPGFQQQRLESELRDVLSNVEFTYIENAGHYPMIETPLWLAALVEAFLAGDGTA
ncbi:MAG: alpha/beta fold hydrolase, partial [Ilumatobacteraceae bacterium]